MNQQHIHFIGICGVAMSALALAFKRQGCKVTGSDAGFYPPVSTHLKDAGIDFYPGWHPDKMTKQGAPDLVVVGNVASSANPEWLYIKEKKINFQSYPEVIREFFVKKNSVVCAGTYGKTTTSALAAWMLKKAGYRPSYMFGGISLNDLPSADMDQGEWSVLEGDEYQASKWDNGPKFAYYSPTHMLLTSVVWDHADVYPTEESYLEAFRKLVAGVPADGLKVISEKALAVIIPPPKTKDNNTVTYGKNPANDYVYKNCAQTKDGLTFEITHEQKKYSISSPCLGEYMADNITGCFALAFELGIAPEKTIAAIASFRGLKRRLEKRYDEGGAAVFDDIAHSPSKATAVLETLKAVYKGRLIAVFEPNAGNRRPQAAAWYDDAFAAADEVIIPRLTKIKIDEHEPPPFDGAEIARLISRTHRHVEYIDDDEKLIAALEKKLRPGATAVFLGSHGFRGMIEKLRSSLSKVSEKQSRQPIA